MNIRLVSTLTADDEDRVAPLLLTTMKQVFQYLRIAYAVRIETAGGRLLEHASSVEDMSAQPPDGEPGAGERDPGYGPFR